jgi:hypothetical protein
MHRGGTGRGQVFDGGTFSIDFICSTTSGLTLGTRLSLPRHGSIEPSQYTQFAKTIRVEKVGEPIRFRVGDHFAPKVGVRNAEIEGNSLTFDIQPVSFPTYSAIHRTSDDRIHLQLSNPAATAVVLVTHECCGSAQVLLQLRSSRNRYYGGAPGASIAGFLDGQLSRDRSNRGRLESVDTEFVNRNVLREMREEIGLFPEDLMELTVLGLASDRVRVHTEFLLFARTRLSARQVEMRSRDEATELTSDLDFRERFVFVDACPDAIATLVSEVKCPIPPTHAAAFLAGAYRLLLESVDANRASRWLSELEPHVRKNYALIDRLVSERFAAEATQVSQPALSGVSPAHSGYNPAVSPMLQGLPNPLSELERVGLIQSITCQDAPPS